jgi:DUF1680 family protein
MTTPIIAPTSGARVRLQPAAVGAVSFTDGFWKTRQDRLRADTLHSQFDECEQTERLENFRAVIENRPCNTPNGEPRHLAADSDVYKWMEGVAWSLSTHPDAELESKLDLVIDLMARAQQPNGYLCTAFMFGKKERQWQDLIRGHELYCAGHLFQAAVAHHRATGKSTLLDIAVKFADHICEYFGPDKHPGTCGHPEIEMALVELFRETGDRNYLDQSVYFVEARGQKPPLANGNEHQQDHAPIREQNTVVGHVVRQYYLTSGVTDIFLETGDQTLWNSIQAQWHDAASTQHYVNGGAGVWYRSEGFSDQYDLPNRLAYGETCAAISWLMWNFRLLQIDPQACYADAMENALYNAILSAITPAGDEYFYINPLEHDGKNDDKGKRGACARSRNHWDDVACCPPNLARLFAQVGGYFYSTAKDGIWAHHFAASRTELELESGARVVLEQQTEYPWQGKVTFKISESPAEQWSLRVRVPGWAKSATVNFGGETRAAKAGEYFELSRRWNAGDEITFNFFEVPRFVKSHPYLLENTNRVAVFRGPILYCLESCDHPELDLRDVGLSTQAALQAVALNGELEQSIALEGEGLEYSSPETLYSDVSDAGEEAPRPAKLKLIPYFLWANRTPGRMKVWLRNG